MHREDAQSREWDAIYSSLQDALSKFGREDPLGDGDYWIVDDNYGSPQHKVCVYKASFLTRPMVTAVQRALQDRGLRWEVLFSFDDSDTRRHPEDLGITVQAHTVIEHWHPERMRQSYGSEFQWNMRAVDG